MAELCDWEEPGCWQSVGLLSWHGGSLEGCHEKPLVRRQQGRTKKVEYETYSEGCGFRPCPG